MRAVPLADLRDAVGPQTRLVACQHVDWTTGAAAPDLSGLDIPVLLDGAQGVGAIDVDVEALGCDFYAGSGQKWLCGPEGTGMLWVSPAWRERLPPLAAGYLNLAGRQRRPGHRALARRPRLRRAGVSLEAWEAASPRTPSSRDFGWPQVHERAITLAATLADELRERGRTVAPRGRTTLVTWEMPEPDAVPDQLAQHGVLIRNLPGTPYVRASVGAWNDESDLERLLAAL